MIKNWNKEDLQGFVFHFQNSSHLFIEIAIKDDFAFLDLNTFEVFNFDGLDFKELFFYEKEDDEDFKGVDVIGTITAENNIIIFQKTLDK